MDTSGKVYYAHTREGIPEHEWQRLEEHLRRTASIAAEMGREAGVSEIAYVAGLLHDIGKYSDAFQARLRGSKRPVDHATAGAREVMALFPDKSQRELAEIISYCIAGHHGGLPDYGDAGDVEDEPTLLARRNKKRIEDYGAYRTEITVEADALKARRIQPSSFRFVDSEQQRSRVRSYSGFSVSFLTRMIYSALVDADWIDTERYMSVVTKPRGGYASVSELKAEFDRFMMKFADPQLPIHIKRTETLRACVVRAETKPGYFTLTVPTGGGKTLSSMAFALAHAQANDLRRIVYVIPFTSIIEQNAKVFREALGRLGDENVLEHHSNFDWDTSRRKSEDEGDSVAEKLKLASENWDIPIIVTTNVQFFESLFANKKAAARKLHNLAGSVIIFDEVQMLPREFLKPCLLAVGELVQNYGASVVFCTATQPSLQRFFSTETEFTELAPNPDELFDFYRRVRIVSLGSLTDEALLEQLSSFGQVLCIVNTRRHAKGLFDLLSTRQPDGTYHLSTLMCPAHRAKVLDTIRERLAQGTPCRVISTQVMEAGIDIDFPVGYRAYAGLDSIIQAAGRVNRENKLRETVAMHVFEPETPLIKRTPTFIQQSIAVTRATMRKFPEDPTTIAAIDSYYESLYAQHGEDAFDAHQILSHFEKRSTPMDFAFRSAADAFKMIDDDTVGVIIPFDGEAMDLIEHLERTEYPLSILRRLQKYTVNIYEQEFNALMGMGALETIKDKYFVLNAAHMDRYDADSGLNVPERSGRPIFVD